jgi:cobalamin biosynthesis protein CobD/CbiB
MRQRAKKSQQRPASARKILAIFIATAAPLRGYYGQPDSSSAGRDRNFYPSAMSFVWGIWILWALLVVITGALHLYSSKLSQNEDDQIYLDDAFSKEKAEQEAIAAKVAKIESPLRIFRWLSVIATVLVIAYYITDFVRQFK